MPEKVLLAFLNRYLYNHLSVSKKYDRGCFTQVRKVRTSQGRMPDNVWWR